MIIGVKQIPASDWEVHCASYAHESVFGETMPPGYDRIDYALVAVDQGSDKPVGYVTVREFDADTAYMKHGGAFEPIKSTVYSFRTYSVFILWLRTKYKKITTLVENSNVVYLKMALSAGFRVIGVRVFEKRVLLELFLEV